MALVSIYHGVSLWQVACPRQTPEDAFYWAGAPTRKEVCNTEFGGDIGYEGFLGGLGKMIGTVGGLFFSEL